MVAVFLIGIPARPTPAPKKEMVYLYNAPESSQDHRYDYHWNVLREALEKTKSKYGPYRMEAAISMDEDRQAFELKNRTGKLSVLIRGDTMEYEKDFEGVMVPIDKGLLGYRVFLIRREDQAHFTHTTTLDELKRYPIGQGSGWKDIDILRANGFTVEEGGDYAGLFAMLSNKRFDLFSRGVEEVWDECSQQQKIFPNLAIEKNLMIYYPIARYFWFEKSPEGERLAKRVREGMNLMVTDGTLDGMFKDSHRKLFERLNLPGRKLFVLKNPLASAAVSLDDPHLWYSPRKLNKPTPNKTTHSSRAP